MQTFIRKHKRYAVIRDVNGRFLKLKRYKRGISLKDFNLNKQELKRIRHIRKIPKEISATKKPKIISTHRFSKTTELRTSNPIKNHKAVMVIEFRFEKISPRIIQYETGYSNKMSFPSEFTKGYNLCLRRAMSKINFSPDNIKVVRIEYNSYVSNTSKLLK